MLQVRARLSRLGRACVCAWRAFVRATACDCVRLVVSDTVIHDVLVVGSTSSLRCVSRQCSQKRRLHSVLEHASILLARTLTCWQKWQYLGAAK